jgi:hypothetical protein
MLVDRKKDWGNYKMAIVIKNMLLRKLIGKGSSYEVLGLKMR